LLINKQTRKQSKFHEWYGELDVESETIVGCGITLPQPTEVVAQVFTIVVATAMELAMV